MKRLKKLFLVTLCAVLLLISLPLTQASAESTGDALVNTALNYVGSSGYVCDTFVGTMAKKAGISESIIPYTFGGVQSGYSKLINNCGAERVTSPQKGDLLFYYCTSTGSYCHVGIMIDSTMSIQGGLYYPSYNTVDRMNYNSYRDEHGHTVGNGVTAVFVRPNYNSIIPQHLFDVNTTLDGSRITPVRTLLLSMFI